MRHSRLLLLLMLPCAIFGSSCSLGSNYASLAASAGHWSGTGCTGAGYVPGSGDTATLTATLHIANGESWTIGASGATGTLALTINTGGQLLIDGGASGSSLALLGGVQCSFSGACITANGANITITVRPPSGQEYDWVQSSEVQYPLYSLTGTAASPLIITTDLSQGGYGTSITKGSYSYGTQIAFTHVRMSNFGTSTTTPAVSGGDLASTGQFVLSDFVCTNCARFAPDQVSNGGSGTFLVTQTQFVNSPDCVNIGWIGGLPSAGGTISYSVFDGMINANDCNANGGSANLSLLTISDTVLSTSPDFIGAPNLVGTGGALAGFSKVVLAGVTVDMTVPAAAPSLLYFWTNPEAVRHVSTAAGYTQTLTLAVFDSSQPTVVDAGKAYHQGGAAGVQSTLRQAVVLPDRLGNGSNIISDHSPVGPAKLEAFEHISGMPTVPISVDEGGTTAARMNSFRGNVFVSGTWGSTGPVPYLIWPISLTTNTLDLCSAAADCDYNSQYPLTATYPSCTGCTGQQNGYITKMDFSPNTVGTHDVHQPPYFSDTRRRFVTWDTLALGNVASRGEWGAGTSYAVGDVARVTHSSNVYYGAPVNYHAIKAHASTAANRPEESWYSQANGNLSSLTVSSNVATAVFTENSQLSIGDWIHNNGTSGGIPNVNIQVASVSGDGKTITYPLTLANGTYTSTGQIHTWGAFWRPQSYDTLSAAVVNKTTYQDGSVPGCVTNACSAIEYMTRWVIQGWIPQNPVFLGVTFPGDTSGITNLGPGNMSNPALAGGIVPVVF